MGFGGRREARTRSHPKTRGMRGQDSERAFEMPFCSAYTLVGGGREEDSLGLRGNGEQRGSNETTVLHTQNG